MNILQPKPYVDEGPQPLVREIPRGADYPVHALGPLKHIVEAVQAATQAPVAIAAQSALSVASLAVQAHADVETLAGYVPTSLFCLTVAQSGERKSGCDKLVMAGLRDIERGRAADHREAMSSWETAHKLWSKKHDRLVGEAAGSNVEKARAAEADLNVLGKAPEMPRSPKLTTSEPTLEGLVKLYLTGQPSLGLFSDEGGGFLGGHAMNSDNRLKTVAGLSCLWGGEPLDRVRAGDGALTLYGRRLASHLMVQPVAARPLLADPIASGQGFLARFLITEPPSAIGTRLRRTDRELAETAGIAARDRFSAILTQPLPTNETNQHELDPRHLSLSTDAKDLLFRYYQFTEKAQAPGGELELVKSFASKSPEQAARIAGVLTLWSDLNAGVVKPHTMSDAIELAQFYLSEARRIAEAATISEQTDRADSVRRWLIDSWPDVAATNGREPSTVLPSDVVQYGPNALREAAVVKKLMHVLVDHGWLIPLEAGTVIDGKARKSAFRIARAA